MSTPARGERAEAVGEDVYPRKPEKDEKHKVAQVHGHINFKTFATTMSGKITRSDPLSLLQHLGARQEAEAAARRIHKMQTLRGQLIKIAKRGRKRLRFRPMQVDRVVKTSHAGLPYGG